MKRGYKLDVNPVYKSAKSVKAKYQISSFQFLPAMLRIALQAGQLSQLRRVSRFAML